MPQTFEPRAELLVKLALLAVFAGAGCGFVVLVAYGRVDGGAGDSVAQPIPFSHKHHVGDVGLDCRFCHVDVETRASAGLPGAALCLTCHSQLFADQGVLAALRRSVASGEPIAWARVYRLPDHVYFDHSVHVAKGVACAECHGRIDQMPLTVKEQPLRMRWCIACHEHPEARRHARDAVFAMPPPRLDDASLRALERLDPLESRRRLTDCSTCHR